MKRCRNIQASQAVDAGSLKAKLHDYMWDKLIEEFESQVSYDIPEHIPEYDPEMCCETELPYLTKAREAYINATVDTLCYYYDVEEVD